MKLRFLGILLLVLLHITQIWGQDSIETISTHYLQEVIVTDQSARNRVRNAKLGSENLELTRFVSAPKMFGETDLIKSITLLPGIHGEADGAGGFEVRGGNAYQNLVTMDGMTLYNPAHLMGIFSTFNDDAISHATIYKGPIPASFGGVSSTVLETFMRSGNMTKYHFAGTIGILNAKLSAEGPIIKDKLSFSIAARRSYVDLFLNLIPQYKNTVMNFFDVKAKIRYLINKDNIVNFSFFASRDNLAISRLMDMRWGNLAGSINWNACRGDNCRFATNCAVTKYTTDMGTSILDANQSLTEYIKSFLINKKTIYNISDNHILEFGMRTELRQVKSGDMLIRELRQKEIRSGWQNALWLDYDGNIISKIKFSLSARASLYSVLSNDRFHYFEALNETHPIKITSMCPYVLCYPLHKF